MSGQPPMPELEEKLGITVITYSRAAQLEATLEGFLGSPFAGCRITILDNASTDTTPEVCQAFAERFADLRHVRHRFNIGLGGNFLRAAELSGKPYAWIIGDDDEWDFSRCEDVVAVVRSGAADLIGVGAPGQQSWERGLHTTTQALRRKGSRYFFTFSFVSNTLFSTDLLNSKVVASGYRNSDTLYPQFPMLERALEDDRSIYLSRHVITRRKGVTDFSGVLNWFTGWIRAASRLDDPALQHEVIYEARESKTAWFLHLAGAIVAERLERPAHLRQHAAAVAPHLGGMQRLALVFMALARLLPARVLRVALNLYDRFSSLAPTGRTTRGETYDELRL